MSNQSDYDNFYERAVRGQEELKPILRRNEILFTIAIVLSSLTTALALIRLFI
jgi:hypothetical protein